MTKKLNIFSEEEASKLFNNPRFLELCESTKNTENEYYQLSKLNNNISQIELGGKITDEEVNKFIDKIEKKEELSTERERYLRDKIVNPEIVYELADAYGTLNVSLDVLKHLGKGDLYIELGDKIEPYNEKEHSHLKKNRLFAKDDNGRLEFIIADVGSISKRYMANQFTEIEALLIKGAADRNIQVKAENLFDLKELKGLLGLDKSRDIEK